MKKRAKKVYTESDLEAAEARLTTARGDFNEIKGYIDEREYAPKRRALVGKCFKYRNSYSCPEKPSDYWWMWAKVAGEESGGIALVSSERDKNGDIRIRREWHSLWKGELDSNYQPVTTKEYDRAVKSILAAAKAMAGGSRRAK